jgi:RNA-directed DNA polymerase
MAWSNGCNRRLRMLMLKQWKRGRTTYRELQRRGVGGVALGIAARFGRSWWHVAGHKALHIALPGRYFRSLGVPPLGPHNLNSPNRRMRTRMSGGVGGK